MRFLAASQLPNFAPQVACMVSICGHVRLRVDRCMLNSRLGVIILGAALALSLRDIYGHVEHSEDEHDVDDDAAFSKEFGDEEMNHDEAEGEQIPVRTSSSHFTAPHTLKNLPTMKFLFCVSCGYRQAFDEFSRFVHEKYPSMKIDGSNYAPVAWKAILAQFIGFSKIALIVLIVMGRDPFASIGRPTPSIFSWALNNKLSSCMMLFLLSNAIESSLMSTGAFEIYLGDEQIWSKLESGRVPSPAELMQIIDQHMEITGAKVSDTFSSFE
ncbi:Putative selT-like protein C35C5.3 [Toxocara canis]|uniref:Putative selT-like protein C35C5.3 n=1 Tax=Toxocara canis TaxID=6265 RepID=A0A0B2UNZ7_TOXCA|nr:Putative selT-like protein C35C5.3 [Toxocara canis]